MKDKDKILGLFGAGLISYYLYKTKGKDVSDHTLAGMNIEINPDKIIDSGLTFLNANPLVKEQLKRALKGMAKGYLGSSDD